MLSKKLHDAINAQINAELWSAYLYLAMSMDAEAKGHKGVANQSILKEISPGISLEGMMLKLKLQYFGHLM